MEPSALRFTAKYHITPEYPIEGDGLMLRPDINSPDRDVYSGFFSFATGFDWSQNLCKSRGISIIFFYPLAAFRCLLPAISEKTAAAWV